MSLAHPLTCLLAVGSVVLAAACALAVVRSADRGPVYAVAALRTDLRRDPRVWIGRTVQVRGVVWPCLGWATGPCLGSSPILTDPGAAVGLALARQTTNPLLAFVRAVPLVGSLVPRGHAPQWGVLASYRVQIRAVPITSCTYWPCYEAVLLDATPDTPPED